MKFLPRPLPAGVTSSVMSISGVVFYSTKKGTYISLEKAVASLPNIRSLVGRVHNSFWTLRDECPNWKGPNTCSLTEQNCIVRNCPLVNNY